MLSIDTQALDHSLTHSLTHALAHSKLNRLTYIPPFLQGSVLKSLASEGAVVAMAAKRGLSLPQLVLLWHLQRGVVAIPRSSSQPHIAENFAVLRRFAQPPPANGTCSSSSSSSSGGGGGGSPSPSPSSSRTTRSAAAAVGEYPSRAAPPLEPLSASEMETLSGLDLGTGGGWVLRDKYRPQQRQEQGRNNGGEPPGLFFSPIAALFAEGSGPLAFLLFFWRRRFERGGRLTMDVVAVFEETPTVPWGFPVCYLLQTAAVLLWSVLPNKLDLAMPS